ncbi:OprD family outer membrane porin, partial [Stutzerimonas azotifigens]
MNLLDNTNFTRTLALQRLTPSLLALAVTAATFSGAAVAQEGFVDGSKLSVNARNFYINRNFVDPTNAQSKAEEWTQSFILNFQSG